MPTILYIYGWRLFFYANEGSEPIHVHAEKAGMECKYWLLTEEVEIVEAFYIMLILLQKEKSKKLFTSILI